MRLPLIPVLCIVLLTACSGIDDRPVQVTSTLSEPEETPAPTTRSLSASAPSNPSLLVDYDSATGLFELTALGLDLQLNRFALADFGRLLAMRDAAGLHNAYFGQGSGTQLVIYSGGTAGNVGHLATFQRVGETQLPLTGSARYSGDYAGFTTTRRINGTAKLDVDFAGGTVGGRITDRLFRQRPDNVADVVNPLSDVILEVTSLRNDGSFLGKTGGGQIVNGQILWNPATGSYAGLIGGAEGQEIVGTLTLVHRAPNGGEFEEVGGFLAVE